MINGVDCREPVESELVLPHTVELEIAVLSAAELAGQQLHKVDCGAFGAGLCSGARRERGGDVVQQLLL